MSVLSLDGDVGRVLGGRYRLSAPIGAGASASVYLADDVTLRRRVAVKVLHATLAHDPRFQRRFRAEAQAAASLNHPNVLGVYDWGNDGVPYLVAEYLGGGNLRSILTAGHRLTVSQALLVGLEAARGLEYAHDRDLVHRDVKPANLLFDDGGRLRIADFGLARAVAEAGWTEEAGSVVGTARYAAPEQARGERVGPAADVFALALSINESICGAVPFTDDTVVGSLMARAETPFEPHLDTGPLQSLLRCAGALDPNDRPSAGELVSSLLSVAPDLSRPGPLPLVPAAGGEGILDTDPTRHGTLHALSPAHPVEEPGPARRWPWAILLALIVAAVGAGVSAWSRTTEPPASVPDLSGSSRAEAVSDLAPFGWELEIVDVREAGSSPGEVLRTDPPAGAALGQGQPLVVYVSLGELLVVVPDVVGLGEADARIRLEEAGLRVGAVTEAPDETAIAGVVIDAGATAGAVEVESGTAIDLIVSTGPADRVVPDLPASARPDDAAASLLDLRLGVREVRDFDETVPFGEVIRFEPVPGESVPVGTEVVIVVSDGPAPRELPDVIGLDVEEATRLLEADGFAVAGVQGSPTRPVLATDPPPGEVLAKGTEVVIATSLSAD